MPDKATIRRARRDKRQGKSASTQAGEFVREEFHHIREGKHGARSTEQAIAIGLSKARRAGVRMKPPPPGTASAETREAAAHDYHEGQKHTKHRPSPRRSRASRQELQHEGHAAGTSREIAAHSRRAAKRRSPAARRKSALQAAHSRTHEERSRSARKGARTRLARSR